MNSFKEQRYSKSICQPDVYTVACGTFPTFRSHLNAFNIELFLLLMGVAKGVVETLYYSDAAFN